MYQHLWKEVLRSRDAYREGKLSLKQWWAIRDPIISSSKISFYAPDKEFIDLLIGNLECVPFQEDVVCTCLDILGFTLFHWSSDNLEERAANKAYFTKKKGIEKLISLIKDDKLPLQIRDYTACCLWNYAELDFQRRRAVKHGLLDCVKCMLSCGNVHLMNRSIGILWGFLEYDDFQEQCISLQIVSTLASYLGVYQLDQMSIIGCLFNISSNFKCRPHMTSIIPNLLESFHFNEKDPNIDFYYFLCLCVANLYNDKRLNLDVTDGNHVYDQIYKFLSLYTPQEMRAYEERNHYHWISYAPFLELTFSEYPHIQQLGLFSIANVTSSDVNREMIDKNGLRDDVIAAALFTNCPYSQVIISNYKPITIPSLKAIIHRKFPNLRKKYY
eukprot:TRINITY_DN13539_c0_g1_i1.p1 TRINITY_DN13539_c0_g1~~TRINITY_DN13539_c0_g1_i1.p1  ORF type:complete len:386 (-),score=80.76 TRINITY_DN13539_c0_g1_i1:154-1311(-)